MSGDDFELTSPQPLEESCARCKFFRELDTTREHGRCHFTGPLAIKGLLGGGVSEHAGWLIVKAQDFCRHFVDRQSSGWSKR